MPTENSKTTDQAMPKRRLGFAPIHRRSPRIHDSPRCFESCETPPLPKERGKYLGCLLFFFLLFGVAGFLWAACYDIWLAFGILAVISIVLVLFFRAMPEPPVYERSPEELLSDEIASTRAALRMIGLGAFWGFIILSISCPNDRKPRY